MASILDTLDRPHLGPGRPGQRTPLGERVARNSVETSTGCQQWTGRLNNSGYGMITVTQAGYQTSTFSAHKAAYELSRGRVPDGMVIDHLCRNRACVNTEHMEVVQQRVNVMRSPIAIGAMNAAKTHCSNGHEYTPENTYVWHSPSPRKCRMRICRACARDAARRRYQERRALKAVAS